MAAKTWTGLGADENWSTPGNWNLGTVPLTGDTCTFDATSTKACTIDDLVGATSLTIQVTELYGSIITQNVSLPLTGSNQLCNSGSQFIQNANITGSGSIAVADTTPAVGSTFTRISGTASLNPFSVGADSTLDLGSDFTVGAITTNSGSTIIGDGDITFVTGTTNLVNGTVWDTSGVTSLLCQGSGTAAHALTIGTTETSLSGVPITVTGAGNFTFTGAPYDFNVVAITKSGSGSVIVGATADVALGSNPTTTSNGMTINGEVIVSGTWNFVALSTASPVDLVVASGAIVSGALTAVNLTYGLSINAAATWPASVVLNLNPNVNTTMTITATAHTFGTCTLSGSTTVALTISSGTSITLAANQTASFTGTFTVTGTLNLLGDISLSGAFTTSASSTLSGTGVIRVTNAAWTMNATCTVSNTIGAIMNFTSGTGRTFAGASKTYASFQRTGSGSGQLTISGSNTFVGAFTDNDGQVAHTILFTASTTQTAAAWNLKGSSGKTLTINSTTTTNFVLAMTGGTNVVCSFISVANSTVDAAPVWYAGATPPSVDGGGGNVNWVFTAPPNVNLYTRQQAQIIL